VTWGSFKYPEALWAPGNLSRFHSDITSCSDCHQAFHGVQANNCITCHNEKNFSARSKPQVAEFHQESIADKGHVRIATRNIVEHWHKLQLAHCSIRTENLYSG
jgi:hypothetical protein